MKKIVGEQLRREGCWFKFDKGAEDMRQFVSQRQPHHIL